MVCIQEAVVLRPRECRLPHNTDHDLCTLRLQRRLFELGPGMVGEQEGVLLHPCSSRLPNSAAASASASDNALAV